MMIAQVLVLTPFAFIHSACAKHGDHGTTEDEEEEDDSDDDDGSTQTLTAPDSSSVVASSTSIESSTITASPTTTSAPSPSPSSSTFHFLPPDNVTICGSSVFAWSYTGVEDIALTVAVTNERAAGLQVNATQQNNGTILVSRTLTTSVSSKAQKTSWDRANVPVGPYVVLAFDTERNLGLNVQSPPFFVVDGVDTSCLDLSSSSMSTQATSTIPSGTSSALASSTSSTDIATPAPASVQPQGTSLGGGALAGTVVGVIAGVLLLLVAFTFPNFWRRSLPARRFARARRPGGPYHLF